MTKTRILSEYGIWSEKYNKLKKLTQSIVKFLKVDPNGPKLEWIIQEDVRAFENTFKAYDSGLSNNFDEGKVQDTYNKLKSIFEFLEAHTNEIEQWQNRATHYVERSSLASFYHIIKECKNQIDQFLVDARLRFYQIQEEIDKEHQYGMTLLYHATDRRDAGNIKRLLDSGADPLKLTKARFSPLSKALDQGMFTLAKEFLLKKISLQAPDELEVITQKINEKGLLNCIDEINKSNLGLDLTNCSIFVNYAQESKPSDTDYSLETYQADTRQTIGTLDHEGWNIDWYSK